MDIHEVVKYKMEREAKLGKEVEKVKKEKKAEKETEEAKEESQEKKEEAKEKEIKRYLITFKLTHQP